MGKGRRAFEGGEGVLLNDSPVTSLLTFHAPAPWVVFKNFKMDSQDISESRPDTQDSCVSPKSSQNYKTAPGFGNVTVASLQVQCDQDL